MPLRVSSTRAHHHEVKIALHSLWYHHTCRWPSGAQNNMVHYFLFVFCASGSLITEINILRCTVSKTWKNVSILIELSSGPSKICILEGPEDYSSKIETWCPNTIINIIKVCCIWLIHHCAWWYQRLCNAILTSWWARVHETCRGMK